MCHISLNLSFFLKAKFKIKSLTRVKEVLINTRLNVGVTTTMKHQFQLVGIDYMDPLLPFYYVLLPKSARTQLKDFLDNIACLLPSIMLHLHASLCPGLGTIWNDLHVIIYVFYFQSSVGYIRFLFFQSHMATLVDILVPTFTPIWYC